MRAWSFPLGKPFGVELRIHGLFVFLLFLGSTLTSTSGLGPWRGVALWLVLLFAIAVRETARALAAAVLHISLRSILLLPIGGLQSPLDPEAETESRKPRAQYTLAIVGPLANLLVAAIIAGLLAGGSPGVPLLDYPVVSALHLLRSLVWFNLALALLHCIPAFPLDAGRLLRDLSVPRHGIQEASRAAAGLGRMLGSAAAALGFGLLLFPNVALATMASPWLLLCGFFVAVGAQLDDQGTVFQTVIDTVAMRDVMLTSFSTVSPSDTLQDALEKAVHSLQDEFPVVRNDEIIGVVSRGAILASLRGEGNGYVQSVMARNFLVAAPEDSLGTTIRRMREGRVGMIPVANEEGRVLGMVTLQNLRQSMVPLLEQRKLRANGNGAM
ncbi:CBS domain-containing protein [Acidipila sp. EB88]|uniref:CBS domain-containing protein n=1 Tax=Acidipila sp. EB88 TaxID=2305226 RepID=UPI000F5E1EE1|nr:CBS domain-containing protein [Acidipila sp. EB88]RRA48547.1 CBS domain-containing protein [Acidipila sp. EB88]